MLRTGIFTAKQNRNVTYVNHQKKYAIFIPIESFVAVITFEGSSIFMAFFVTIQILFIIKSLWTIFAFKFPAGVVRFYVQPKK